MIQGLADDVKRALIELSYEELCDVQFAVENQILAKANLNDMGYHFDQIRDYMVSRFGTQEMDRVRSWRGMSPREKELFTRAWLKAKETCRKWQIEDSVTQAFIIYYFVSKNPELKTPSTNKIIFYTRHFQTIITQQFPNYTKQQFSHVVQILKSKSNYESK